jgi:hypothetical protein
MAALSSPELIERHTRFEIPGSAVQKLRFHLEALGLIQAQVRRTTGLFPGRVIVWTLTSKGRRYVAQLRAIPSGNELDTGNK